MTAPLLDSAQGVTLIGGGEVAAADLAQATVLAPAIMAADSGAGRALAAGLVPLAVAGDFDSLSPQLRAQVPADRLHHIAEQDTTDFEKCLSRVAAPFVVAVGFAGPRHDHLLANLTTLIRLRRPPCLLLGGTDVIFAAPPRLVLDLPADTRVSIYPLGPVTGESRGLRWPLAGLALDPAGRVGTSNAATGGVVDLALDGPCIVILPRRHLGDAVAALAAR
ncbi:thiamine diphosphokinase [Paracoccus alkenifer]|uniref:Thiamine diphosphokinase n=1 Tax=Paracoccus alkenifer TaxID=65735 RepID=A0A1H6LCC4_9RHOB|nr:thiamine diphosphokinase [Paracoccus alkenifer]SEH86143.1 thiamine pyrophosphokinase [Paracoccus alkenifer]